MLKLSKGQAHGTPVETTIDIPGGAIDMELIPCDEEDFFKDLRKFRKTKMIPNPITKRMDQVTYFDDDNPEYARIADALLLKHLVSFTGVVDDAGDPIDGTLPEAKLLLGKVVIEDTEDITITDESGATVTVNQPRRRYMRQIIFERVQDLARVTLKAEIKN